MLFPSVRWNDRIAGFLPPASPAPESASLTASLVFAVKEGRFLTADIAGRGWCIPGGHLWKNETPEQAARRETLEETGAQLGNLRPIGLFTLTDSGGHIEIVPMYVARVIALGPLPDQTESRGTRWFRLEELPHHYHVWDELMEVLFQYAAREAEYLIDE